MQIQFEVVIVGAGASGVGVALALRRCGITDVIILEREAIGAAFLSWPKEMRFITPSFPSNGFGLTDLNSIAPEFSVGIDADREHPSGVEYAAHLERVVEAYGIKVETGVDVLSVTPQAEGFEIGTSEGIIHTRFVVWAAGEFFYPRACPFPGSEFCTHNSRVEAYSQLEGDEFLVIGGYESGIDAAFHLTSGGRRVRILDTGAAWETIDFDPSLMLSPYTVERLDTMGQTGLVELVGNARVVGVETTPGGFLARCEDGRVFASPTPPILATGFEGSLKRIAPLFDWSENGNALLSEHDESLQTPGLWVCGPMIRHHNPQNEELIFCFIYKFRMRFMVVAAQIAARLGAPEATVEAAKQLYARKAMLLEDLSCCDAECGC